MLWLFVLGHRGGLGGGVRRLLLWRVRYARRGIGNGVRPRRAGHRAHRGHRSVALPGLVVVSTSPGKGRLMAALPPRRDENAGIVEIGRLELPFACPSTDSANRV